MSGWKRKGNAPIDVGSALTHNGSRESKPMSDDRVTVVCPCCRNKLTVDTETGEILAEERPKQNFAKTFDDAVSTVRGGADRREEAFSKAFDRTQKLDDLLNKKFEEARKKAEKDTSKPHNPLDLD